MRDSLTILIDMDDVMENLVVAWCKWLNENHGTNVDANDIVSWDVHHFFPSLTEEEVFAPTNTDEFWATVQPKEGAVEYIRKLCDEGFAIYICTASDYRTLRAKFDCVIKKYFEFIDWKQMIITNNKQLISGDILIDDGVHNLVGGKYKKILMSAPHNQSFDAQSQGITRVNSWKEAYEAVHQCVNELLGEEEKQYESN